MIPSAANLTFDRRHIWANLEDLRMAKMATPKLSLALICNLTYK